MNLRGDQKQKLDDRQKGIDKRQKIKLNPKAEEFKRSELLERYTAKLLLG